MSRTNGQKWVWVTAIASSLVLVLFVLSLVDWEVAKGIVKSANRYLIVLGVLLLAFEGFLTAARFKLLAINPTTYAASLRASGWYVLLLLALPARLGEVAGIGTMVRYMGQRTGDSMVNLFLQRVFDVLTLGAMFCVVCVQAVSDQAVSGEKLGVALSVAGIIMAALIASVIFLDNGLGMFARCLIKFRRKKIIRSVILVLLEARRSIQHHLDIPTTVTLIFLTMFKWLFILGAIACVVIAVAPTLSFVTALGVGIAYNLAAVIPLQTIGGAGISEVVLLGSFKWLGYATGLGASLAIAIRLALLVGPIAFGLSVLFYFEVMRRGIAQGFVAEREL